MTIVFIKPLLNRKEFNNTMEIKKKKLYIYDFTQIVLIEMRN